MALARDLWVLRPKNLTSTGIDAARLTA